MNSGLKRLVWPRPLGLCSARMYPRFFNAESAVIAVRFVMPASLAISTILGSRLFAHEMESAHATRIVAPGSVLSCNTRLSQMYDIMVRPAVKGVPRGTYSPSWWRVNSAAGDTYLPLVLLEPPRLEGRMGEAALRLSRIVFLGNLRSPGQLINLGARWCAGWRGFVGTVLVQR